jgi:hypothetical protein
MEDYINKIVELTGSIFDDKTSKKISESFSNEKTINPNRFIKGKPITKKKLIELESGDICFVKYWDDDHKLQGNSFQYLSSMDDNQTVFFVDYIGSIFSASFDLSYLDNETILEDITEGCGWSYSIFEAIKK